MSITSVPIRATISFGGLSVSTPYILSFNVTKTRNSKSTFSASLKVLSSELSSLSDNKVTIIAGEQGNEKLIFTGFILSKRPSIAFDDPNYTVLNISGSDALYRLEGEKYTRRKIDEKNRWAIIEGLESRPYKGSRFDLNHIQVQLIDQSNISKEEREGTKTRSSYSSVGTHNLPEGTKYVDFHFGAVKYDNDQED